MKIVIAAKQTVINEVYVLSIKYRYSHIVIIIEKYINFIYSDDSTFQVIRKMDFIRAELTCYRTNFLYSSSG